MSWSSGKDSAMALHTAISIGEVEVVGLLTTVNAAFDRVAMHGVRRSLLEAQAAALGLPLEVVELPWPCPNAVYEEQMARALARAREVSVDTMIFGDLFLEDVRSYREAALEPTGVVACFPLWHRPTGALARDLVRLGFRAIVTCVDLAQAPRALSGRWFDEAFLDELPPGVDPCGENGEFHTVVVDGPDYAEPIDVVLGETVERDGYSFTDVLPVAPSGGGRERFAP